MNKPRLKNKRIPLHKRRNQEQGTAQVNRPENVPTDVWATANADEQAFIIEHENLHKQFRDWLKATADFAAYVKLDVDHIRAVFPFKAEG